MISLSYLFEGKVIEHIKRNKGKYLLGAGLLAAGGTGYLGHEIGFKSGERWQKLSDRIDHIGQKLDVIERSPFPDLSKKPEITDPIYKAQQKVMRGK